MCNELSKSTYVYRNMIPSESTNISMLYTRPYIFATSLLWYLVLYVGVLLTNLCNKFIPDSW